MSLDPRVVRRLTALLLAFPCLLSAPLLAQDNAINLPDADSGPTVGYPAQLIGLILPGPRVVAKAFDDREQPLVVRILDTYSHGSQFRYDIEYYGLEKGVFNLSDYLVCEDSTPANHLPAVNLLIGSNKSSDGFPVPAPLPPHGAGFWHGYRPLLILAGIVWVVGLLAIIFVGRPRRAKPGAISKRRSVADRLRPLVEQAAAGTLDDSGKAELERTLEAFWRQKLELGDVSANELRTTLRGHPEAQIMLQQFDTWLYRPGEAAQVDLEQLLTPYQSLAADELAL